MGTVRFELRKDKVSSKTGAAPIRIIYQMQGIRCFIPTDIKIHPLNWNIAEQEVVLTKNKDILNYKGKTSAVLLERHEIKEVSNEMDNFRTSIKNIEKRFEYNNQSYSINDIVNEMKFMRTGQTHKEEPKDLLYDFMDQYISDHKDLREPGSLTVYKSVKNHLKAFEDQTKTKVRFDTIDYNFFAKFQTFLINRKKTSKAGIESPMLNNVTIAKALSTLKTFLNYGKRSGIKVADGYRDFSIKKETLEVIALEQSELDALLEIDLSKNKRLDQTRDAFCFSCSTGLRYSDIAQLRREHIKNNIITITVKKTKSELTIPLNSISAAILEKYKEDISPLPVISNQKLNDYIKELCKLAEINSPVEIVRFRGTKREVNVYPKHELIHMHTGRKTFITLSLEKGLSAEQTMAISGHLDYRSFKRYVNVTEKLKKAVMVKAWGEVSNLKVV